MNERIEHCLYQAGLTAQGCWEDLDTYMQEGIEKFAELIVGECIDTVQRRCIGDHNREDQEVLRCVADIKQHFGVADPDPYSDIEFSEEYDAYYSISKNEWIESKCDDPTCEYCIGRPERPLEEND